MSRPIPAGVEPPRPNTVIQGWGGDFIVPRGGFSGWKSDNKGKSWREGDGLRGCDPDSLYAAPFLSDVNTLNAPSLETSLGLESGSFGKFIKEEEQRQLAETEAHFERLKRENPMMRLTVQPDGSTITEIADKDALIRELVGVLEKWQSAYTEIDPVQAAAIRLEAFDLTEKGLTLARTTCPEVFE